MTRDEHRAEALRLLEAARPFPDGPLRVASPERLAIVAEAQLHATLALSAPSPSPVLFINAPDAAPTTTPARKRTAAKKVAPSKETSK